MPKLIKLNPVVIREVFNRLLGLHGDSPISPSELLVSLHLIDSTQADLKTVIKATSMCLQEKQVCPIKICFFLVWIHRGCELEISVLIFLGIFSRSSSCSASTTHGANSATYFVNENRHPSTIELSQTVRFCNEHLAEVDFKKGKLIL